MLTCWNVTLTSCAPVIVTVQVDVVTLAHAPPHVGNSPGSEVAVSATFVPLGNEAEQPDGQPTPVGVLVTLPEPVTLTRSANTGVKLALTLCAAVIDTIHVGPDVD